MTYFLAWLAGMISWTVFSKLLKWLFAKPVSGPPDPWVQQVVSSIESEDGWEFVQKTEKFSAAYLNRALNLHFAFNGTKWKPNVYRWPEPGKIEPLHFTTAEEEKLIHEAWKRRMLKDVLTRRTEMLDRRLEKAEEKAAA